MQLLNGSVSSFLPLVLLGGQLDTPLTLGRLAQFQPQHLARLDRAKVARLTALQQQTALLLGHDLGVFENHAEPDSALFAAVGSDFHLSSDKNLFTVQLPGSAALNV